MVLTRQERKDLVLDLYNQGRTYREIAEEARMSPLDMGTIVNNAAKEKEMEKAKEYQDTRRADEKKQEELHLTLSIQGFLNLAIYSEMILIVVSLLHEFSNLLDLHLLPL